VEAYEFVEWRASRTSDYQGAGTMAFLTVSEAGITEGTDGAASVTLNVEGDITLIPWSKDRPRITQCSWPHGTAG
jgi:hypothetical protein